MRTFFISFAAANQHAVGFFKLFIYDFLFLLIENESSCYKFSTHKGGKINVPIIELLMGKETLNTI